MLVSQTCGWVRVLASHMEAWWWDKKQVSKSTSKQITRLEKLFIRPNVNERSRSSYFSQRNEQNCEVFNVAKIIIRNDDNDMLTVSNENKLA